jgi:hypothetical protein
MSNQHGAKQNHAESGYGDHDRPPGVLRAIGGPRLDMRSRRNDSHRFAYRSDLPEAALGPRAKRVVPIEAGVAQQRRGNRFRPDWPLPARLAGP